MRSLILSNILFALVALFTSCKKMVEIDPPSTSITTESAFSDDVTAASVLTGIYTNMASGTYEFETGGASISVRSALSSDELVLYGGIHPMVEFYSNKLRPETSTSWPGLYKCLLPINRCIEEIVRSNSLSAEVRNQLLGEAKFLRAFCYFYLVNLYGDVPLLTGSDYRINSTAARTAIDQVYKQIVSDLIDAKNLLNEKYVSGNARSITNERVRPNKWAAAALLARVYLYQGNYAGAEAEASSVIDNNSLFELVSLNDVFKKNSKEAIWQLQPVDEGWNTNDAKVFIITGGLNTYQNYVYLSDQLCNSFDSGDNRKNVWISSYSDGTGTYYYPYKYKSANYGEPVTEYLMVLRLGEQYLIRAEARANGAGTGLLGAIMDVNIIRTRAGLSVYPGPNNRDSVLKEIYHERQVELFTEWGHRWLDLKRTNRIDEVMTVVTPLKGGAWQSTDRLYPIPQNDVYLNPNLIQNPGY